MHYFIFKTLFFIWHVTPTVQVVKQTAPNLIFCKINFNREADENQKGFSILQVFLKLVSPELNLHSSHFINKIQGFWGITYLCRRIYVTKHFVVLLTYKHTSKKLNQQLLKSKDFIRELQSNCGTWGQMVLLSPQHSHMRSIQWQRSHHELSAVTHLILSVKLLLL